VTAPGGGPSPLQERLIALARALRQGGVPVAVSDDLDASRAAAAVDLLDRNQLRAALAATMIKSPGYRPLFDTLFDVYFPARLGEGIGGGLGERPVEAFLDDLVEAVAAGDDAALRRLAREAVASFGRVTGRDGSPSYFGYRIYRQINPAGVLRRLLAGAGDDLDPLTLQLLRDDFETRLRRFREDVDAELRQRQAERRSPDEVGRTLARPLPEEVDFLRVSAEEQAEMRRAVRPLARRLAVRLAVKRRRGRSGRLDARRTMRRSLDTGGVPVDPVFRRRRPHRPELVLLCDVSGSVAAFARFTLLFSHALQGQVSRVRSFAFIDTVDEVTHLFADGDVSDATRRLAEQARVVWLDGHSDYGHAFERFLTTYADAVTPRSTLLVLGDARNNYRATSAWALAELHRRARRLYWLNPEPRQQWGTGDSVTGEYGRHADAMVECRNLRQLAGFIEGIV
jgi:uncharacterized protein